MEDILKRNHVQVIGEGPETIVFGHGFGCDQSMWQYITPAFKNKYKIVLFDYVGAGKSEMKAYDEQKYNELDGYVADLLDVIQALELEQIVFVGHSVSSMIGMHAAIRQADVFKKIVMIGPSPCYINDGDYVGGFDRQDIDDLLMMMEMNFEGWASYLAPIAMNNPETPQLSSDLEATFKKANPLVARQFAEATFLTDHREFLALLKTPTLILQCAEDSIVPVEVGHYLNEALPNSELYLMKAKGHYPHISHPEETIDCIEQFLNVS